MNTSLKPYWVCAVAGCLMAAVFLLAQQLLLPYTEHQARPQGKIAQQTHLSQEMDRLSRELETRDKLSEWPDARRASAHSGYALLTTTLGYVGGNDYEEYFAFFSETASAQGKKPFVLIGWAMVPAPFRFEDLSFEVRTNAAGEKYLRLFPADNGGEPSTSGEPGFVDYLLPEPGAWGIELGK